MSLFRSQKLETSTTPEITWPTEGHEVPFSKKVEDVVMGAFTNGHGLAYGSTDLPQDIISAIGRALELCQNYIPPNYNRNDAQYWLLKKTTQTQALRKLIDKATADDTTGVLSVLGGRKSRTRITLNNLEPKGVGEPHQDDFLTVVYAQGDAVIKHRPASSDRPFGEGLIRGSGVAAFCGLGNLNPGRLRGVAPEHRVDNPSEERSRASIAVTHITTPMRGYLKLFADELHRQTEA